MIAVQGLTRRFGPRLAVDGVTLSVRAAEVVALLGPNGAGKTTTLRMLAGLLPPSAGEATIDRLPLGPEPAGSAVRARVGLLTETPGLWDRLSVEANVEIHARLHGVRDAHAATRRVLLRLGVIDRARDGAGVLSRGLRQRVALARAIVHAPPVLLLDEPTSGLDPEAARTVRDVISDLRREGAAVLLCTHNLAEVEQLADRIAVLKTRLLFAGTSAALRAESGGASTVIVDVEGDAARWKDILTGSCLDVESQGTRLRGRLRPGVAAPDVVTSLVRAGARVCRVDTEHDSLERAYLSLVGAA